VIGFGRADGGQDFAVGLHVGHRNDQERWRLLRPDNPAVPDEGQNAVRVGAAGVDAFWGGSPSALRFHKGISRSVPPGCGFRA
jgi:hypothetical protein